MMDHAFKQFIRNLLMSLTIFLTPLFFIEYSIYENWVFRNLSFLISWIFLCGITGFFAYRAGKTLFLFNKIISFYEKINIPFYENNIKATPLPYRLPVLWSGCSRCMSYSTGGIISFTAAVSYFYKPAWAAGLYFLFLGASLTSAFSMFFYLKDEIRKYRKIDIL